MEFISENLPLFMSGAILLLVIWIIRLEYRLKRMLVGKDSQTIEDSIKVIRRQIETLAKFKQASEKYLEVVDWKLKRSISGTETIRFNPFKGTGSGGNQSFATSFVSEAGDGVVISSLYSRERTSIFAKPVKNWISPHELTAEEKESIKKAREQIS